jgi:hypothetical protein
MFIKIWTKLQKYLYDSFIGCILRVFHLLSVLGVLNLLNLLNFLGILIEPVNLYTAIHHGQHHEIPMQHHITHPRLPPPHLIPFINHTLLRVVCYQFLA